MKPIAKTLISFFLLASITVSVYAQCPTREADSLALVTLYNAFDGPNWNTTWDLNQPMNVWHGIDLTVDGCVLEINLSSNNLEGELPNAIGDLSEVVIIRLTNNMITGSIPASLGNLSALNILSISTNQLAGNIPAELSNLSNLIVLDLNDNNLTGIIPINLTQLSNVEILLLAYNDLTGGIPNEIINMTSLKVLMLRNNVNLGGPIPSVLGDLPNLIEIRLGTCGLTGPLPPSLGNLDLDQLLLNINQLTGEIPASYGNFVNLPNWFNVANNNLTGEIPPELGNLLEVSRLDLSNNDFLGEIPSELQNLTNLATLKLANNQLTGTLPEWLGGFQNLDDLRLDGNSFEGCFPASYSDLCNVNFKLFNNNAMMPWSGDFEIFCTGEDQIGAPCDDQNSSTENDVIQPDCSCEGEQITGIEDFINQQISLYPNPSSGAVNLEFELVESQNITLHLYNVMGQRVWSQSHSSIKVFDHQIRMDKLPAGQYLLSISDQNGKSLGKKRILKK